MEAGNNLPRSFTETLFTRAENYFESCPNKRYASPSFYIKCMLLISIYIFSYVMFILFSRNIGELLAWAFILGICHVFIPVNMSHDAIHGAVSSKRWMNDLCRYGFDITGSNSYMYGLKHLEAHYNKENGSKMKAIESQGLLLQKHTSSKTVNLPFIFYLFYAQYMIFVRDLVLFFRSEHEIQAKEYVKLALFKSLYIIAFIVLPFTLINVPWWQVLLSLLFMYLIVTIVLVIILLMPTEKMEHTRVAGSSHNEKWITEILEHNVDFSPGNVLLTLMTGGANLNVVHYLFPAVNHVHYNKLAVIIENTAVEYGLLYRKQRILDVFAIHFNYLKNIQNSHR